MQRFTFFFVLKVHEYYSLMQINEYLCSDLTNAFVNYEKEKI